VAASAQGRRDRAHAAQARLYARRYRRRHCLPADAGMVTAQTLVVDGGYSL
jgi:hypothetical protein